MNLVSHEVDPLITQLHPTPTIQWTPPYARSPPPPPPPQLFLTANTVSAMEWTFILVGLHWVPCAAPYNYFLQWTVSTMVWALSLMHSKLLCTIDWTPPYPLCYALQLFHSANSVNHGVGPLINTLHATLYDWVDSTLPSVLSPANSVNHGVGPLINTLHPTLYDWVDFTLPSVLHPTTISYSERSGLSY